MSNEEETDQPAAAAQPTPEPSAPQVDAEKTGEKPAASENGTAEVSETSPAVQQKSGNSDDVEDEEEQQPLEKRKTILDTGYEDVLQEKTLNRDSDDSDDSVGSYVRQKSLLFPPDFFELLGTVPELSDISEDVSEILEVKRITLRPSEVVVEELDEGLFVDPVTGEVIEEEEEPPPAEVTVVDEGEEEGEEEEEEEEDFEDDDLLDAQIEDEVEIVKKPDEDDVFETFLDIEPEKKMDQEEFVDKEALMREAAARRLLETTQAFINDLISRAVDKCEYIDPMAAMRENLDKIKLMQEMQDKLMQYDVEQRSRNFLNRKTVEYYRRKKAFRTITEDPPETVDQEITKFKEALINLDCLMGKELETSKNVANQMDALNIELHTWQQNCRENIYKLEELMRKTLLRDNFDRLKTVLDGLLTRMAHSRDEVSQCRLMLLQRQHTFAVLTEKLEKLEDLGNGLRMRDFEHLQTETQALGKKIEERNAELSKLRTRCNADLHIMAHMREKQQMIRDTITIQESVLIELLDEKQMCRKRLFELKLERERIRKEMRELSFQGGLLDKPALMMDFDETAERLDKLRAKVDQMRARFADIQQRIQNAEKKCEANR